jgi:hypothetical protein
MEKMNQNETIDLILNYVTKEYLEDEDEAITYDTPLISGGYVDSYSMIFSRQITIFSQLN